MFEDIISANIVISKISKALSCIISAFSISSSEGLIPLIIHEISNTRSRTFVIPSCVMSPIVSTEQSKLVKNLDAVAG